MKKPVRVYTLNMNCVYVPKHQDYIEQANTVGRSAPLSFVDNGDEPCKAVIDRVAMPIFCVSRAQSKKLGMKTEQINTYIAVDPDLMEHIEVKHKQELETLHRNYIETIDTIKKEYDGISDRICDFIQKPWYNRIWCAITKDI